ncbi:non-ribosomal peptide synthetase (plasmid) [Glutamicibacter sp. FR1]|uniref:non-ribosomal peptide synthetase n=1 Tax=Glutamicibacter sp. FR1 TaxID=3393744 RepID=UPI0039B0A871
MTDTAQTLWELVLRAAERWPKRTAIQANGTTLTYQELTREVNERAQELLSMGFGAGQGLAIEIHRGPEAYINILASLSIGMYYVPIGPDIPEKRQSYLLEQSSCTGTVRMMSGSSTETSIVRLKTVDTRAKTKTPEHADLLAYLMFTSGSSGKPKGVMMPHRGPVWHIKAMQELEPLTPDDRVLQKVPLSFDVSVREIFWTLSQGATLVAAPPRSHLDAQSVLDIADAERITVLHFVPNLLRPFVDELASDMCKNLRLVICGGEPLSVDLAISLNRKSNAQLINVYGPTETSIDVTSHSWSGAGRETVPIGRPLPGAEINVVEVSSQAQLAIAGPALSWGYIGASGETARRFRPQPGAHSQRMYLTGDAVTDSDWGFIYSHRVDEQFKFHGVRIEPGEIEARLREHPEVNDVAVVVSHESTTNEAELVATIVPYRASLVPQTNLGWSTSSANDVMMLERDLKNFCREMLPGTHIPSAMRFVDELPRLTSGKIDRRSLRDPQDKSTLGLKDQDLDLSKFIAEIMGSVLNTTSYEMSDDFFLHGGHSLAVIRLLGALRRARPGILVSVRDIYDCPTPETLAIRVRSNTNDRSN